jgi:RNA polymerase sigma-70 factor (ECF subfamily)
MPFQDTEARVRSAVDHHISLVWRSLRRFGVWESRVDDALQGVFLTFSARLSEIAPGAERSFLLATSVRVAANVRRLDARSPEVSTENLDSAVSSAETPEELLDWKQRRAALDRALDTLPLEQRAVFVLYELEGFSLPEIAQSLEIPLGTATSRLRRARGRFEALAVELESRGDP